MIEKTVALKNLREKISEIITNLETWETLHDVKNALGLSDEDNPNNLGKLKYLTKVTFATSDRKIIDAANQMLKLYPSSRGEISDVDLQHIQDDLWWIENEGIQKITNVTRYKFAESMENIAFWGRLSLKEFFVSVIAAQNLKFGRFEVKDNGQIYKVELNINFDSLFSRSNPPKENYTLIKTATFFRELGISQWTDQRFSLLLERIVHPEVQNAEHQERLVKLVNVLLHEDGFELREEGKQGGLPIYKTRQIKLGVSGKPKYLIFASIGAKPDIVINDTVNMDILINSNSDKCLVYDQLLPDGDLTWKMLVDWWKNYRGGKSIDDQTNRKELGKRLGDSLQSEPEKYFFKTYFQEFKPILGDNLPALLPQVYLHYDPRHQSTRKQPVLVRQRMDFLILLRNASRVVIEIDGIHHYSEKSLEKDIASSSLYAKMVEEDRRIKLLGYEVYRFGGAEFVDLQSARKTIIKFFNDLFTRHNVN